MFAWAAVLPVLWNGWQQNLTLRSLGIALWIGLAVLTVTLLILMRTRWGQAKPVSKCVFLSLFAHVLLGGFAYGTHLVFEVPMFHAQDAIRLQIVEPSAASTEATEQAQPPQPWEQFVTDAALDVDNPRVARSNHQHSPPSQRQAVNASIDGFRTPLNPGGQQAPERPEVQPSPPPDLQVRSSQTDAAHLQRPEAQRHETPDLISSTTPQLNRMSAQPQSHTSRSSSTHLVSSQMDTASRLQELAQPSRTSTMADMLSGHDQPHASVNGQSPTADRVHHPSGSPRQNRLQIHDTSPDRAVSNHHPRRQPELPRHHVAPRRLGDGQPLPAVYQGRSSLNRQTIAIANGGSVQTEQAVKAALKWLARHQNKDGRWDASQFAAGNEQQVLGHHRDGAGAQADTGVTGLAILAFLAAGHSHLEGPYRVQVRSGLEFLLGSQRDDGSLAGNAKLYASMYCHGMASMAISEAYALTGDERLKPAVRRAVQFSVNSQHPSSGGWRYQPGDRGDMSQFGWQVMALKSAHLAGIEIPSTSWEGMYQFIDSCASGPNGGKASYRPGQQPTPTMTAESLVCRYFLEQSPSAALVDEAVTLITSDMPSQDKPHNLYFWYYGCLALQQSQHRQWSNWNQAVQSRLLQTQRTDDEFAGSWNPNTVWGGYGGRVYSTALATLCLEVYYRYLPLQK